MLLALIILLELLFVATLVLFCYRLQPRFGLAPLYIFIGANLFIQSILVTRIQVNILGGLTVPVHSTLLFSAGLFAILLVYIKEGVLATQRLILSIALINLSFIVLSALTDLQQTLTQEASQNYLHFSTRIYLSGTVVLMLDAFILVILYEFFLSKIHWLTLYSRLVLTMLIVFNFDAVAYVVGSSWGTPEIGTQIISQLVGKSIASVFFSSVLFVYLRFLDTEKNSSEKGVEDIFSILSYRGLYEKLKIEKEFSDRMFQKHIRTNTQELEKSVNRFTILSGVRELRMDKFTSSEQAEEFLVKVKDAFEGGCLHHSPTGG